MSHIDNSLESLRNGHAHEPAVLVEDTPSTDSTESEEVIVLRGENAALRAKVDELTQLLELAGQDAEDRWTERVREYEALLDEKSEVIRNLHQKVNDLREQAARDDSDEAQIADQPPDRQELLRLQRDLETQRRQIQEDEEAMMQQLRQMEMALAKDRADLARQRAELQRLHGELKHEVESAARNGGLRDRLVALQRRAGGAGQAPSRPAANQDTPPPSQLPKPATGDQPKNGLFRRIFG
jgi:chromosome segregation ATPase